jgi:hypothetical protein
MKLQHRGIDTIFQVSADESKCLEEKIVFMKTDEVYSRIFLETESCTVPGLESDGWMHHTEADELYYGIVTKNEQAMFLYIVHEFQKVRTWFFQMYELYLLYEHYPNSYPHLDVLKKRYMRDTRPTENRTSGLLVPITDIIQITKVELIYISLVPEWHYTHLQLPKGGSPLPDLLRRPLNNNTKQVKQSIEDVEKAQSIERALKYCQDHIESYEGA